MPKTTQKRTASIVNPPERRQPHNNSEASPRFEELNRLARAIEEGRLSERARLDGVAQGERPVLEAVNRIVDALTAPLSVAATCIGDLANGVIPPKIADSYAGDLNAIRNGLNACIDQWSGLLTEMNRMSDEHNKGDIDVMIPADRFEGAYRTMARGVNDMVAGHITVKKKAMACIEEFSKGNFDAPLEQFAGKKAFINENIERLRENVKRFIEEMNRMSDEHIKGDIDASIPLDRFEGAFRIMARGVNEMVGGHIMVKRKAMACIAEFGRGNFEAPLERFPGKKAFINETIEAVRENLKGLIVDMDTLARAASEGKLATRADASKHGGDFRQIVEGVNRTLDAVIGPLNVSADYVDRISKGDIPPKITDNYNGDFNTIKQNLNVLIEAMDEVTAGGRAHCPRQSDRPDPGTFGGRTS